ncbi:MAG: hypothetical protein QM753_11570 [Thermomicrobiales bacterium]
MITQQRFDAIDFTPKGNSRLFVQEGWSEPEVNGTWTVGHASRIVISEAAGFSGGTIEFVARAFTPSDVLPAQQLSFWVNGHQVYSERLSGHVAKTVTLPDDIILEEKLEIELKHPDARSPEQLGLGGDVRDLSFCFYSMSVKPRDPAMSTVGERDASIQDDQDSQAGPLRERPAVAEDANALGRDVPAPAPKRNGWLSFLGW